MSSSEDHGPLFVISGPSCVGKDTLAEMLTAARPEIARPVTTTTREPRPDEEDGREYYFLSESEFMQRVQRGDFLEHARVHARHGRGALYGLTHDEIRRIHRAGRVPVVILDVQGARTIRRKIPSAVTIFIAPESREALAKRIGRVRPTEEVAGRIASMEAELESASEYDVVIRNPTGRVNSAFLDLLGTYDAEVECFRDPSSRRSPEGPKLRG